MRFFSRDWKATLAFKNILNNRVVVRTVKSKGPNAEILNLTVGDIKRGNITDTVGYVNDIVLFLRKGKE